jgi:hypothetical protein
VNAKKFYYVLIGILTLLVITVGGSVYVGTSLMKKSSDKLVKIKLDNIGYDAEEQTYLQARKDLDKYASLNETMQKILPKSKDQAKAVKELYQLGDETNIVIDNIQFPTSTLGQKSTTATNPATSSPGGTSSKSLTQAKSVEGMPGVMGIDLSVSLQPASGTTISYDNMIKFLQKVENNRRSMQIKDITVNADTKSGGVTFDLTLTIFVKP